MSSRFTDTTITMQYFIPEPPQMLVPVELTPAHTHLHPYYFHRLDVPTGGGGANGGAVPRRGRALRIGVSVILCRSSSAFHLMLMFVCVRGCVLMLMEWGNTDGGPQLASPETNPDRSSTKNC